MERIPWNQYFMAQSVLLSLRSTCKRLEVGATIVRDKRIIAGGYNGHCVRTIHAEMNAILQCAKFGAQTENAEIYVTHFPCLQCTKMILQAGIKKIYYLEDYHNDSYAIHLLDAMDIPYEQVPLDPDYFYQLLKRKDQQDDDSAACCGHHD